jgi:hypothetical protein
VDKDRQYSTIVIDKANGDFKIKRRSPINWWCGCIWKTTLTGRYELKEGAMK